ncbi:DNA repair protein rhp26 [Gnomoniopsis smithogilvyi]|uniref:DNA repair protein rhp26 n=1 Tax=Gnomoniopsis smithogilvyi TaxID=1191159 RepID=A0A9W9CY19_9PEZI|nr:DNA repair protein rhp26 [Gnomoniopsis smithogilvyi]
MSSFQGDQVVESSSAEMTPLNFEEAMITDDGLAAMPSPDTNKPSTPADLDNLDEEATLQHLSATARDQDDLERDISHQANLALIEAEDHKDKNRIAKAEAAKAKFIGQKKVQEQKLRRSYGNQKQRDTIKAELARIDAEIKLLDKDIVDFNTRIDERNRAKTDEDAPAATATGRLPGETKREFLIRTGKITPFAKIGGPRPEGVEGELANAIVDAEDEAEIAELENKGSSHQIRSHQNLRLPGFAEADDDDAAAVTAAAQGEFSLRPRKKRKTGGRPDPTSHSDDEFDPGSAPSPEYEDEVDLDDMTHLTRTTPRKRPRTSKASEDSVNKVDFSKIDDGNESAYRRRLTDWVERRSRARRQRQERDGIPVDEDDAEEEWFKPSPDEPDHELESGLRIPGDIFPSLFDYQKTGVQWLAELYEQQVGGIVGDEMGLGKTIQVISFVAALHYSKKLTKPVLIVAPATVLQQWVAEFHRWWPALRVSILHSSGSGMLNVRDEDEGWDEERPEFKKSGSTARKILDRVIKHGHVLVTTYAGIQTYRDVLIPVNWEVAVLDEGHKIRNPNTTVTINCKELLTPNRIILSGTPMQNNLIELWSIFDFINPMHLGSLVAFRSQFEVPIRIGGYANATKVQMMTAQKCAETLKDAISPYLLQRTKKDVAADLPKKKEQVLFCKLTPMQRGQYMGYIQSSEMTAILNKTRLPLAGISMLRKICNHPELARPQLKNEINYKSGSSEYSGKMQVVKALIKMWKRLGHKALLFSQGVQMLDILEHFLRRNNFNFLRMDGSTQIKDRQRLVDQFNNDPDIDIFLLTTKVGGLGVNLTGASRVIIYDPDWNPSTDVQARERAWRLGQKKEVAIYRLMTAGTIEEKIYQRQIWKQFLANKVLNDPKQRTNLNVSDLHDLFTLSTDHSGGTETSQLFSGSDITTSVTPKPKVTPGLGLHDLGDQRATLALMPGGSQGDEEDADLQDINGVTGVEEFKGDEEENPDQEEDRIMAGIYAKGVDESLDHDEIVGGKRVVRADPTILRAEAVRVAKEGAEHLRRSREQARNVAIGTVTWTGEVGTTGRPRSNLNRGRGGPGSSSVLAGIRGRQGLDSGDSSRSSTPLPPGRRTAYGIEDFKKMIVTFLKRNQSKAPSKMIIDQFSVRVGKDQKAIDMFKAALDRVATLESHSTGRGALRKNWVLKKEFQEGAR